MACTCIVLYQVRDLQSALHYNQSSTHSHTKSGMLQPQLPWGTLTEVGLSDHHQQARRVKSLFQGHNNWDRRSRSFNRQPTSYRTNPIQPKPPSNGSHHVRFFPDLSTEVQKQHSLVKQQLRD
ncbi:hypothetical protein CRENBAI_018659 [Crenichthys baileyi]|uniref:Uncharacterized protein n=1 Tax=Crenichthys baileyi TaxID=28760 RepID=A0AAV9S082_9TELE